MNPPVFFLLVDAIPHGLAHEVWAEGGLHGFREPRPVVSVFPSLTEVAVPALLSEIFPERPPGYEARYYHPPSREVRGGLHESGSGAATAPYRARPRGAIAQAGIYLLRARLAEAQIRWINHRFAHEGGPWLGYLSATDGVGHFDGRASLVEAFRDIAASVHAVRSESLRRNGVWPGVVLCSDHGMSFGPLEHLSEAALADELRRGGFPTGHSAEEGVVLVPHGEVGGGVVHCRAERAAEVALVVSQAPGVELVCSRTGDGCMVFGGSGRRGRARVRWRGDALRYECLDGDPLEYAPLWRELERDGRLRDGWADDRELFRRSLGHRFPDALARLRRGLEDLVRFPAPVLFSMRDGWTYGPALTHAGARMMGGQRGTHGALSREQSLGFAAVTDDGSDPWAGAQALRPEDVFRPWREWVRAGSAESP
ncbi:MAG: hypothetical protein ACQGVK_07700 [Myxococcota bacterium]